MTCPVTPSPMVATGAALACLLGLLGPSGCDSSHAQAVDRNSLSAAIASNDSASRSVLPTGWRRTTRGWERAEMWANELSANGIEAIAARPYRSRFSVLGDGRPQTVGQWMLWDQAREPVWANTLMGVVKRVHPLCVAVFLIAVAVLITRLSEPSAMQLSLRRASE